MNLGPPVAAARTVALAIPEHAGRGRDTQPLDIAAEEQDGGDALLHPARALGRLDSVRAGDARPVEQRMDSVALRSRPLDPEIGEGGKFLASVDPGVDGDTPRRQAILVLRARRAEIGRALKGQPVALPVRRHRPKTGNAQRRRVACLGCEERRKKGDGTGLSAFDDMDADRVGGVAAEREQADAARQRLIVAVADGADRVIVDRGGGLDLGLRAIGASRKRLGARLKGVPGKGLGLAQLDACGRGLGGGATGNGGREAQGGKGRNQFSTIGVHRHLSWRTRPDSASHVRAVVQRNMRRSVATAPSVAKNGIL